MTAVLAIEDLHVSYGAVQAVRGVSAVVPRGEVHALLGGNGAGKSSLLRAVLGVVQKDRGTVHVSGRDITEMAAHDIVRTGVGFCPQGRDVFGSLTVRENLQLGASSRRLTRSDFEAAQERILELLPGLANRLLQRAGTLSGGEQQMLSIGRALIADPTLLLLDEPTSALSPAACDLLMQTLSSLRSTQVTIVLVEQNVEYALGISDHAYVLAFGRIVRHGTAAALKDDPDLLTAYLGLME